MTGPEHYRQAEVMAAAALEYSDQTDQPETHHVQLGQLAQVHALLAVAAASVDSFATSGDERKWAEAIR